VRGNVIEAVGASAELPRAADDVIDASYQIVIPGLVNTHHHMYQTLTRVIGPAQDCELFTWLQTLYPIWAHLTPEMIGVSTQTAMAELLLSGCTTSTTASTSTQGSTSNAASRRRRISITSTPRGFMSVGEVVGRRRPTAVEDEAAILAGRSA
jgi:cytosine/adenosine deaminase-related metal-dependent hydrolase